MLVITFRSHQVIDKINEDPASGSTLFLHGVCIYECIHGECAHEQHVRRTLTLTLTHTITAYSVSGNVRVRILISTIRQKPCRKRVYPASAAISDDDDDDDVNDTWLMAAKPLSRM